MDRLEDCVLDNAIGVFKTEENICGGIEDNFEKVKYEFLKELKQYRDTGLTPEQMKEIDRLYTEKCREVAELEKLLKAAGMERNRNGKEETT